MAITRSSGLRRVGTAVAFLAAATAARGQSLQQLQAMSIEQLAKLEVTSVLRRPEKLSEAAAAIFVITPDDIRRSGAITLPEALRLAPNLDVAQVTSQTYAISARGFNATSSSNKILVLIDGRPVYEPMFSGVYWDQLQVPLDDIDRIEVISGPGGTQWGANAVNGVINIITKSAFATQGGLADLKAGNLDQYGLLQYGGKFGQNGAYRVYGQGFGIGSTRIQGDGSAGDQWHGGQAGFRTDWALGPSALMTEGGFYRNNNALQGRQYGGDIVGRWSRHLANGSDVQVQASFDQEYRVMPAYSDTTNDLDLQAQDTTKIGRHTIVFGGEYRRATNDLKNHANIFELIPPRTTIGVTDLFVQDTYAILPRLKLTLGTKLEYSGYSGLEPLPSIRLGWAVSDRNFIWAAVSRAVRIPTPLDRNLTAPVILAAAPAFRSEKLIAYELGYRGRPTDKTSLSVTLYYNQYHDLRITGFSQVNGYVYQLQNGEAGDTYGLEAWGDWQMLSWWRLSGGANLERKRLHVLPGYTDISFGQSEGYDPDYQFMLRSSMNLAHHVTLDVGLRAVGRLMGAPIQGYVAGDINIAWHVTKRLELSLSGFNLFTGTHAETLTPGSPVYLVRRSVYLGLRQAF